jgi:hypothetical protein
MSKIDTDIVTDLVNKFINIRGSEYVSNDDKWVLVREFCNEEGQYSENVVDQVDTLVYDRIV